MNMRQKKKTNVFFSFFYKKKHKSIPAYINNVVGSIDELQCHITVAQAVLRCYNRCRSVQRCHTTLHTLQRIAINQIRLIQNCR